VVCVTWDDARAYARWLARKTGKPYRLLSEAEWEYAARGRMSPGGYSRFWFGNDEKELCRYGNFASEVCDDGYKATSPTGHYPPNAFDLYDMAGNAWQWTEDCWHDRYYGAPSDGSVWTGNCSSGRVLRGGAWNSGPRSLRAANREGLTGASSTVGFRVARSLNP
jgi:formylglycine-generating enzyme required for sulfatase activity